MVAASNRKRRAANVAFWSRQLNAAAVAAACVIAAASCRSSSPSADRPRPGAPPVVQVTMREMAFDHGPIPAGRVVLEVRNVGQVNHRLSVVPVPEDLPPLADQLRGTQRRFLNQVAGTPERLPGQRGTVAVDLLPSRYAFMCFVVDPDGVSHTAKGMFSEFRVG